MPFKKLICPFKNDNPINIHKHPKEKAPANFYGANKIIGKNENEIKINKRPIPTNIANSLHELNAV